MEKIEKTKHLSNYIDNILENKYIYMIRKTKENNQLYIYQIINIECKYPVIYKIKKCKMLNIPDNKQIKSYIYDNNLSEIQIQPNDIIYKLTDDEFINIFRKFITLDNTYIQSLNDLNIN